MARYLQVDTTGAVAAVVETAGDPAALAAALPAGWLLKPAANYPGVEVRYSYDAARDKFTAPAAAAVRPAPIDLAAVGLTDRQVLNAIARALGIGV